MLIRINLSQKLNLQWREPTNSHEYVNTFDV